MKVVINPSWKCQLHCPYCWVPHVKIDRNVPEHQWQEWAEALIRIVPRGSIVDVCGGEPLLYPGIHHLMGALGEHGIRWAITTNAMSKEGVKAMTDMYIPGCVQINVSDHTGNASNAENVQKLRYGYQVMSHRVNHAGAGEHEPRAQLITYQPWKEGIACDGIKRMCNAGMYHWVTNPAGDAWRCVVDMQVGNKPFGNLFDNQFKELSQPESCEFGCTSCYTENPREWMVEMERI
jgi:hypothetical protein